MIPCCLSFCSETSWYQPPYRMQCSPPNGRQNKDSYQVTCIRAWNKCGMQKIEYVISRYVGTNMVLFSRRVRRKGWFFLFGYPDRYTPGATMAKFKGGTSLDGIGSEMSETVFLWSRLGGDLDVSEWAFDCSCTAWCLLPSLSCVAWSCSSVSCPIVSLLSDLSWSEPRFHKIW
jgi:hypothetical protein